MKCRRVEKLIPLYVEGDLGSGMAERLASHLEWCGRCNFLADEYKDSQSWLRSSEPPVFDEASLNGFKAGVLGRIAESKAKPSFLESLMQQWTRRQVFALATAVLFILGMVVIYVYQTRARTGAPGPIRAESSPSTEAGPQDRPNLAAGVDKAPGADLSGTPHRQVQPRIKSRAGAPMMIEPSLTQPVLSQLNPRGDPGDVPAHPADPFTGLADDSREMLRIEIQTSDPNIRIIWFAPKEVENPQTDQ